jgi:ABC-type bacteriocin/lantibiotic exporter with double-glycine peptidase domain
MCGPNNLALVLAYLNDNLDVRLVDNKLRGDGTPYSVQELKRIATELGYKTTLIHWNEREKASFNCPALLHVRGSRGATSPDHFIACFGDVDSRVCIGDFPRSPFILANANLYQIWDGDALYVDRPDGRAIASVRAHTGGYWDYVRLASWRIFGVVVLRVVIRRASTSRRSSKTTSAQ